VTTAITLLDVLPEFLDHHRVETLFAIMPGQRDSTSKSANSWRTRACEWWNGHETTQHRFDLIIAANDRGPLDQLSGLCSSCVTGQQ
jgi:hypothetical protein